MKISIITPSYNSGNTIERAILSVRDQGYQNFEHLVIDGGSTDETISILESYPHVKWISEKDRGQVHAMNKGFEKAEGQVIGYLNADDYYLKGTFLKVMPYFLKGEQFVMGKVLVISDKPAGKIEWVCDPRTDFHSAIRHWERDAFCVNPVGYFYLKDVQLKIPLLEDTGAKHDLEFLIEAAYRYRIKKINHLFGVFNHECNTKTAREQLSPAYWNPESFLFVERFATNLGEEERNKYLLERERGYQFRRYYTIKEAFASGLSKQLLKAQEVILLPEGEDESFAGGCGFVEHDRFAAKNDWIIPVFISGKVASKSICESLISLPPEVLSAQVYHIHQMNPATIKRHLPRFLPERSHAAVGLSLKHLYDNEGDKLQWKFIAGVREPVSGALSGVFENWPEIEDDQIQKKMKMILRYRLNHFDVQYKESIGVNVYDYPFDHHKKYMIIENGNVSILIYRLEDLSNTFSAAIEEYLGIENLSLPEVNISKNKDYAARYFQVKENFSFDVDFLREVYEHQFVRHFYSITEINNFIDRWAVKQSKTSLEKWGE